MKARPLSLSIIAWYFIGSAIFSICILPFSLRNPAVLDMMRKATLPLGVQIFMAIFSVLKSLVCGIFLLRGAKWARTVWVGFSVAGLLIGLATSPMKLMLIPAGLFFGAICFFLYRPSVNEYLETKEPVQAQH